ncbi:hypothetical protein CJF42_22015 [Pseudoalteromonas sp. NBT06-2]|uniref:hypothetical protein n=1 Tax=Pseudoalteromonas sp. NBT06-2 TaxID=2025950 RepID=UPI000BA7D730|nr:hypothetical protein [Pseudoalteromonas sp. NBT06-2]PAJ72296.1 hypothetical protein CJF42_22015 [Pseudoalteromonas sp. NBT06-2]
MNYLFDKNGLFVGTYLHKKGQALPKYLFTDIAPPDCSINEIQKFIDGDWVVVNKSQIIPINIDSVTNKLEDFDDNDNEYTLVENSNSVASGVVPLPNKKFRVPFVRLDVKGVPDKKSYMVAVIENGAFTITLNFKTGGEWIVNTELLNSELTEAELALFSFSIADHKFKVV